METSSVQLFKLFILAHTGLSRDAIHVYIGLFVFFFVALVSRRPIKSLTPWLAVVFVACALEIPDAIDDVHAFGYWRLAASGHDIVNTLLWPSVMVVLAKFTPAIFTRRD
jgi:hypothetical protein